MEKKQVGLIALIVVCYWAAMYSYVPILTPYVQSFGASVKMVGVIGGSYGLMQFVFRIPIGMVSDKLQKRKALILLGMGLTVLSGVSFFIAKTQYGLLVSRALSGIAASFLGLLTVVFSAHFKETTKGVGLFNAAMLFGLMMATLFGGWAAEAVGRKIPFIASICLGGIALVLTFFIKEKKVQRKSISMREILEVRKNFQVVYYSVLGVILQFISYGTAYVFTPLVAERLGAGDTELGFLIFIYTLPSIIASLIMGTEFVKKIGYKNVLGFAFVLMAVSCIPAAITKSLNIVYLAQFVSGFGRGIGFSLLLSFVIISVPAEKKATATGFYQAIYALGMFLGPIFTGLLSTGNSFVLPYTIIGLIALAASVCAFIYRPKDLIN